MKNGTKLTAMATVILLLTGCNQGKIDQLTHERDDVKAQLQTEQAKTAKLEEQVKQLEAELTEAQTELNTIAHRMPIRVGVRRSEMASGLVFQMKNTSGKPLSVKVTMSNPTFDRKKVYDLVLEPNIVKEIGHLEGWKGAAGDTVLIESEGFNPIKKTL